MPDFPAHIKKKTGKDGTTEDTEKKKKGKGNWNNGRMEWWNVGLIRGGCREKFYPLLQHSNIPCF
jgi:hypothetical protein